MMFEGITPQSVIEYYNLTTEEEVIFNNKQWTLWFSTQETLGFPLALEYNEKLHSEYRWNGREYVLDEDAQQYIPDSMKRIQPSFRLACEVQREGS